MKPPATARAFLLLVLACICLPLAAWGQQQQSKDWTWKDRDGHVRSRADLDEILARHTLWTNPFGELGDRADLSNADLSNAHLSGADLSSAILSDAKLSRVDLSKATLLFANLRQANLTSAILCGTDLLQADLSGAMLSGADLRGALLTGTNLKGAYLGGSDLTGADLWLAKLAGATFEPKTLPLVDRIAQARGLELMTYADNPGPLTQLRKQFQDAGFREQERQVTCALNREEARRASFIGRWFKRIAFDYTCEYGLSPGRPLRIVFWLWVVFAAVYAEFITRKGPWGIYFIGSHTSRGRSNTQGLQIRPRAIRTRKWWKLPFHWLWRELRVLRAAMFFSLMSAFNIGFRDINFGRWLRLLTTREYDLKAVGWARTVSGFQSLLSVYLIALWVLTYFGRPFG